ncbi:MAG: hypothetical protein BEN19_06615 [Epulopiscium sp. Nuni2H_MBin003]|nr:MAG: hypothetical protein BEN19_06615 [Epulopiscium sp. Nuni2H_MBin003]
MQALGLVEVIGFVTAVCATDAALKSADVRLVGVTKVGSGIVTIILTGDVGAINAAVESAAETAERVGVLRDKTVIARASNGISMMFENPSTDDEALVSAEKYKGEEMTVDDVIDTDEVIETIITIVDEIPINEIEIVEEMAPEVMVVLPREISDVVNNKSLPYAELKDQLRKFTLNKIRGYIKNKKLLISANKLKSANKEELIELIINQTTINEGDN